jgi:hypothetical protein
MIGDTSPWIFKCASISYCAAVCLRWAFSLSLPEGIEDGVKGASAREDHGYRTSEYSPPTQQLVHVDPLLQPLQPACCDSGGYNELEGLHRKAQVPHTTATTLPPLSRLRDKQISGSDSSLSFSTHPPGVCKLRLSAYGILLEHRNDYDAGIPIWGRFGGWVRQPRRRALRSLAAGSKDEAISTAPWTTWRANSGPSTDCSRRKTRAVL